jgi:hypothetical protein
VTKGFSLSFLSMCVWGVFCGPCWVPCCSQFRLLLQRSWRQISRDKAASMARLMSNLSSAIIFGAIFWRMQVSSSRGPPGHTFLCLQGNFASHDDIWWWVVHCQTCADTWCQQQ